MAVQLFLNLTDETGRRRRVEIEFAPFFIGRTPDNDLPVADSALSRRHCKIERFGDTFVLSDAGSSNGTSVNGKDVTAHVPLFDGDRLSLGGAVEITVEIIGGLPAPQAVTHAAAQPTPATVNSEAASGGFPIAFIIAPVFGVLILLTVGALLLVLSGEPKPTINVRREEPDTPRENRRDSEPENDNDNADADEDKPRNTKPTPKNGNENTASNNPAPVEPNAELDAVERNSLAFLRGVTGDTGAVLTQKQLALVNQKIKAFKASPAFRENLAAARRNAAGFNSLGSANNLKPEFLQAIGLAKLGDSRGDALATANALAPELRKFGNVLGLELANDCLLVVAASHEGGSPLAVRDRVANLASKTQNASATTVRTIWFLQENGKIDNAAFDYAVRFLAAGTILVGDSR